MLDAHGFLHDAANAIHAVIINRLVVVRCLIHCEIVENILLITLVDEKQASMTLDDHVPRVKRLRRGHDGGDSQLSGEDVGFLLGCEALDDWVFECRDILIV